jgi:lipoprotein signal peptidase
MEFKMVPTQESRSEKFLRFSRQSTTVLLLLILAVGGVCVAMAFRPASQHWTQSMPVLWIIAAAIAVGLQRTLGGDRWDSKTPEVRAIVQDEWRRANMDRARRFAFVTVLGAQIPLGLLLASLPPLRAVMAMASATITIGLSVLLALFLYFDRDAADAG